MDAPGEARPVRRRRLVILYALIVGAVAGVVRASTVGPVGIGGGMDTGAPIYLGAVVAVSIVLVDTVLRSVLDRWPIAAALIPLAASSVGVLVGWWALHNTMGGPT